jgi:hypothetical protein
LWCGDLIGWVFGTISATGWSLRRHILFHVIPDNRLPLPQWYSEYSDLPDEQHMAGLVLGITVTGPAVATAAGATPRRLTARGRTARPLVRD